MEGTHSKTSKIELVESIVTWQFHSTTATLTMSLKKFGLLKKLTIFFGIIGMRCHCQEDDKRHTGFKAARRAKA
jgi:hypothetical protein